MKKKRRIYIAGKISGEPMDKVEEKFKKAQMMLMSQNYIVVNPLEVVNDWSTTWEGAMRKCIAAMMDCDAVYFLNDWQQSTGATLEKGIAFNLKMSMIHEARD